MIQETYQNTLAISAESSADWRRWLEMHHAVEKAVWLIIFKKSSGIPSISYSDAVDDALCFGWIDSKPNKRDGESYYQFFAKRNPKSNWSAVNKAKVERLISENRMTTAGFEMVKIAKQTGTWTALDDVENLVIPADLQSAFAANHQAWQFWELFPKSTKRGILEWIMNAKRPETRQKRIVETVAKAAENVRANQFRQPKRKS